MSLFSRNYLSGYTNGTCNRRRYSNVPPSRIIHVAFVFVKTLTKRCLPTWRPFNLHSRRLVWDNLVFSRRRPLSLLLPRVALSRNAKALSRYYYHYNVILVPEFKDTPCERCTCSIKNIFKIKRELSLSLPFFSCRFARYTLIYMCMCIYIYINN